MLWDGVGWVIRRGEWVAVYLDVSVSAATSFGSDGSGKVCKIDFVRDIKEGCIWQGVQVFL